PSPVAATMAPPLWSGTMDGGKASDEAQKEAAATRVPRVFALKNGSPNEPLAPTSCTNWPEADQFCQVTSTPPASSDEVLPARPWTSSVSLQNVNPFVAMLS